jgi:lipopolysaccharide/colanic/teichoic acid biosynthesis glycosyltransferase/ADP-glucose pyrophosphorylase
MTTLTDAVVLAGSPGSALCPLASLAPRHALPVANEPPLVHVTRSLGAWGIRRATVVVRDGDAVATPGTDGLRLDVVAESEPRGTAGALRQVVPGLEREHVLVVDGSLVGADVDLAAALDAHRARGAGVTAIVHEAPAWSFRERIEVDDTGAVRHLSVPYEPHRAGTSGNGHAKPVLGLSGIYLVRADALDLVPEQGHFDIKEQLVPLLLDAGVPVHTWRAASVRRISTFADYIDANHALVASGFVPDASYRAVGDGVRAATGATIADGADVRGPVLLGAGCRVEAGARIVGPTVVGAGSVVHAGAEVRESVLWRDVRLAPSARVSRSVVTDRASVPDGSRIDESVVFDNTQCNGSHRLLGRMNAQVTPGGSSVLISHDAHSRRGGRIESIGRRSGSHRVYLAAKRGLDLAASIVGLALLWPLMMVIAVTIRLDSRGPAVFRQVRCGRGGRPFTMLKFRTMTRDAEARQAELVDRKRVDGPMFKMSEDPRVTRVGRFLRRTSLDEIPQLVNVLRGEMTLVGPRPLVMEEMRNAPGWRDIRLMVKPGITGLWQSNGRTRTRFADWIRADIEYVRNQSMLLDLRILLRTAVVVLGGERQK